MKKPTRIVVPVVEERVRVDREVVDRASVKVHKTIEEHQETVREPVVEEQVEIERVPVRRQVEEPEQPRYEGDTLVVPVMEEVLVVEKRWFVTEEIRIRMKRSSVPREQTMTLRREHAEIERTELSHEGGE